MDDMPAYPDNFQRFGRGFVTYDVIIVGWIVAITLLTELLTDWQSDDIIMLVVFPCLALIYFLFYHYDRMRGLYAVPLRYVFLPQVGMRVLPKLYLFSMFMVALSIGITVYYYGFRGGYNENLLLPSMCTPFILCGYMACVHYYLNHGGTLPRKYMPF